MPVNQPQSVNLTAAQQPTANTAKGSAGSVTGSPSTSDFMAASAPVSSAGSQPAAISAAQIEAWVAAAGGAEDVAGGGTTEPGFLAGGGTANTNGIIGEILGSDSQPMVESPMGREVSATQIDATM